jgi:hypothetical protein
MFFAWIFISLLFFAAVEYLIWGISVITAEREILKLSWGTKMPWHNELELSFTDLLATKTSLSTVVVVLIGTMVAILIVGAANWGGKVPTNEAFSVITFAASLILLWQLAGSRTKIANRESEGNRKFSSIRFVPDVSLVLYWIPAIYLFYLVYILAKLTLTEY